MTALFAALYFILFTGAFACYPLKGKKSDLLPSILAGLAFLISIALVVWAFPKREVFLFGPWIGWIETSPKALFGFFIDPLSSIMLIIATLIGALCMFYSPAYLSAANRYHAFQKPVGKYYFFMLLFVGAMVGIATAPDFLQLTISLEITTICSWALISYKREPEALIDGYHALLLEHLGGLCLLVVLMLLYVETHSFSFDALEKLTPGMRITVFGLLLAVSSSKAAQIPFHTWLPAAMEAPPTVSAYLHSAAMVKAGVYVMARTVISNPSLSGDAGMVLSVLAVVTMFVALLLFFAQDDLKRLLAYSTIVNLSYILLGVSFGILGSSTGYRGGVFHIINHAAAKALLFLTAGAIAYGTGVKNISELSGLGRRMPFTAASFMVGAMALTAVPPFSCFWSKYMIFSGAFQLGTSMGTAFGLLIVIESILEYSWFVYTIHRVFFGEISENAAAAEGDPPFVMRAALVVLMFLALVAPAIGFPFVKSLAINFMG